MPRQIANHTHSLLLRQHKLKATAPRLALLEILQKNKQPLSPQKICAKIKNNADVATIYRILKLFKDRNIVRQVDFHHDHTHFELIRENDHHHHFVCTNCGLVRDISVCPLDKLLQSKNKSLAIGKINDHSVELFGICKNCLK